MFRRLDLETYSIFRLPRAGKTTESNKFYDPSAFSVLSLRFERTE